MIAESDWRRLVAEFESFADFVLNSPLEPEDLPERRPARPIGTARGWMYVLDTDVFSLTRPTSRLVAPEAEAWRCWLRRNEHALYFSVATIIEVRFGIEKSLAEGAMRRRRGFARACARRRERPNSVPDNALPRPTRVRRDLRLPVHGLHPGASVGGFSADVSFDRLGSYTPALIGYAGALVGAAFLVNRLGPYVYLPQPLIGPELAPRPTG
jgi:hypothetical protein